MQLALAVGLVLAIGVAPPVRAQVASSASASDRVAAEALFEEGRTLVGEGKIGEACPKFAASERLDTSSGTLLNLASCWEKLGHTATAWATYRQAASAANAEGRRDYVATAQRHADALAPRLARLTVNVPERIDGIELKRDGLRVTSAEWGASIPVDPGAHVIVASAPGRKTWTSTVDAAEGAAQLTVDVPILEPVAEDATRAVEPAPQGPPPSSSPTLTPRAAEAAEQERHAGGFGLQRTAALVAGGLGVASLGVGTGLAVSAKRQYDDSLGNCLSSSRNVCSGAGVSQRESARNAGNAATFAFAVGVAALLGGGVLWLTAPRPISVGNGTARISLVPTIGGAFVMGTWQ